MEMRKESKMKKIITKIVSAVLLSVMAVGFAGCNFNSNTMTVDDPVTKETLNTSSEYVIRGFIESVFCKNREIFEMCFPEEFLEISKNANVDLYEQYSNSVELPGEFAGTHYESYVDFTTKTTPEDFEKFRADIALFHGLEAADITAVHLITIDVYFVINGENNYTTITAAAYCHKDKWYMYEIADENTEEVTETSSEQSA